MSTGVGAVQSHYHLKQNLKATAMFPTSYLYQNKQRFIAKTDEARETVLALKRLFADVNFWLCMR